MSLLTSFRNRLRFVLMKCYRIASSELCGPRLVRVAFDRGLEIGLDIVPLKLVRLCVWNAVAGIVAENEGNSELNFELRFDALSMLYRFAVAEYSYSPRNKLKCFKSTLELDPMFYSLQKISKYTSASFTENPRCLRAYSCQFAAVIL
jgi:hypothetical protein